MTSHIEELNPGLKGLGRYEYGWADADTAGRRPGVASTSPSSRHLGAQERAAVDARPAPEVAAPVRPQADAEWGSDLTGIDFQNIKYFVRSTEKQATSWEDLPEDIKNTYEKLGIPEAESASTSPA
jgi:Fe-S cluster assembly protein SufB